MMEPGSIFRVKPIFLVMQTQDDNRTKLTLSMFSEKRLSLGQVHRAAAIVSYDPVHDSKKPFRVWKDRYLANYASMDAEEFKAYVSAWIEVIEKHNAK